MFCQINRSLYAFGSAADPKAYRLEISGPGLRFVVIRDFKIVDNGRLRRLDAYTGDLGRVR